MRVQYPIYALWSIFLITSDFGEKPTRTTLLPTSKNPGLKQQHLYGTISILSLPSFIRVHQVVLEKNLKMWKIYRRTGGWTKNRRRDMTIAHLSHRLRWAKSRQIKLMEDCKGFYTKRKCELHPFYTLIYQYLMVSICYDNGRF